MVPCLVSYTNQIAVARVARVPSREEKLINNRTAMAAYVFHEVLYWQVLKVVIKRAATPLSKH